MKHTRKNKCIDIHRFEGLVAAHSNSGRVNPKNCRYTFAANHTAFTSKSKNGSDRSRNNVSLKPDISLYHD